MNEIPKDIIPSPELTLERLRRLNDTAGQAVTITEPGELVLDVDGFPHSVGPSIITTATMAGAVYTRAQLDRLGGNPDDYPNLRFIDNTQGDTP